MTTIPQPTAETPMHGNDALDDDENDDENDAGQHHDSDPLVQLREQLATGLQAVQQHISIIIDGWLDSAYSFALALGLGLLAMACIGMTGVLACYYLVSGVVSGLQQLTGSPWIGQVIGGLIFLLLPVIATLLAIVLLKRRRAQRHAEKYRDLLEQDDPS